MVSAGFVHGSGVIWWVHQLDAGPPVTSSVVTTQCSQHGLSSSERLVQAVLVVVNECSSFCWPKPVTCSAYIPGAGEELQSYIAKHT